METFHAGYAGMVRGSGGLLPGWISPKMGKADSIFEKVSGARADANIDFRSLCLLLEQLGFERRIRGSHHIFHRSDVVELLNLQKDGSKAKPYQVRQVRAVLNRYGLKP